MSHCHISMSCLIKSYDHDNPRWILNLNVKIESAYKTYGTQLSKHPTSKKYEFIPASLSI